MASVSLKLLTRVFKLMVGRWRSQPIRQRLRDRQPITGPLQSLSFEYHLRDTSDQHSSRLSTLWHFIAYIDITDEQEMAKQKADERARMIENTKRQKNLEAEEAEQDDTLLEEDNVSRGSLAKCIK